MCKQTYIFFYMVSIMGLFDFISVGINNYLIYQPYRYCVISLKKKVLHDIYIYIVRD